MPQSGKYRVVINGFEVKRESWDDALQRDGKRDEVEIRTKVIRLDKDGNPLEEQEPASATMGDINNQNGRVQAGTASDKGGLRTGDKFPTTTPWRRTVPTDINRDYPPMLVWEGELVQGEGALIITPTIWEWDFGQDFLQSWVHWANGAAKEFGSRIKRFIGPEQQVIFDLVELGLNVAVSLDGVIGTPQTRPIGLRENPTSKKFEFNAKVLALTYDKIEALLNSNAQPAGKGVGVFAFRFTDEEVLKGDYVLYVQVERVVPPSTLFSSAFQMGDPLPTWRDAVDWFSNVTGYFSHISPECSIRTGELAHSGDSALMYSGTAKGGPTTYCYYKCFEVNILITTETKLSYWIFPQQDNGRYVALDFHCSDGTTLRDSGAIDDRGCSMHPHAGHSMHVGGQAISSIPLNDWSQIKCNVGLWLAGKTVDRIWVAYDRPKSSGQYRGYIDDILIINGNLS